MSIMHHPKRYDGYYNDHGQWTRTKFCFRSCGDKCTCTPPNGQSYSAVHDKSKRPSESETERRS